MSKEISSISFQEDFVIWTEMSIEDNKISLKKAVSDSLPLSINYETLQHTTSSKQIANHLNALAQKFELNPGSVRITIPSRFSLIKKITVDESVPGEEYPGLVAYEMEKCWNVPRSEYQLFLPEYSRQNGPYTELLTIGIRKNVMQFFEDTLKSARLGIDSISPGCFTVEEYFRTAFPNMDGQTLLVGWQRRGYDLTISEKSDFVNYAFRPYSLEMGQIEQLDEEDLISGFEAVLDEVQHPPILEESIYDIKSVFFYGFHFKPQWLELIKAQISVPVHILNFGEGESIELSFDDPDIDRNKLFQLLEPISNIY